MGRPKKEEVFNEENLKVIESAIKKDRDCFQNLNELGDNWLEENWLGFGGWLFCFPKKSEIKQFYEKVDECRAQGKRIVAVIPFDFHDSDFHKYVLNRGTVEIIEPDLSPVSGIDFCVAYIGADRNNIVHNFYSGVLK